MKQTEENNKMADLNPTIPIITLNVSELNTPIKRQRLLEQIKIQDPSICCLKETNFKYKTQIG